MTDIDPKDHPHTIINGETFLHLPQINSVCHGCSLFHPEQRPSREEICKGVSCTDVVVVRLRDYPRYTALAVAHKLRGETR